MAIIALLSLSAPALQSVMTSGTFNSNTSRLNDLMRAAYSAAIARNTYVWVGLTQMPNNGGVGVAITYSASGDTSDVLSTAPSYLFKPVVLKNLTLATISSSLVSDANRITSGVAQLLSSANNLTVTDPTDSSKSDSPSIPATFGGVLQTIQPNNKQPTSAVLEITPTGQVSISASKYAWVEIGLQPSSGNRKEAAVLQMNSFTGRVVQFLP